MVAKALDDPTYFARFLVADLKEVARLIVRGLSPWTIIKCVLKGAPWTIFPIADRLAEI